MNTEHFDDLDEFLVRLSLPEPFRDKVRYFPYRLKNRIRDAKLDVKNRWERSKNHFGTSDVWGFMFHNAEAQVKALTALKAMGNGHPVYGEVQTMEDWNRVLDVMIDGWQAMIDVEDYEGNDYRAYVESCQSRFINGMHYYVTYYQSLWD